MTHSLVTQAMVFATTAHTGQFRKSVNQLPYIVHPLDVMEEVTRYSGLVDQELELAQASALLHDTIEDTDVTAGQLRSSFSSVLADDVEALSKDPELAAAQKESLDKTETLVENLERIKARPVRVWCVKLADRVSNLKSFPDFWSDEKISKYLTESEMILDHLGAASEGLAHRLFQSIAAAR